METIRAFLAVPTPADAGRAIRGVVDQIRTRLPNARFVSAEQWHITLHFFASLTPNEVDAVREAARAVTASQKPFLVSVGGLGVFPGPRRPRVLWLGVGDGGQECTLLHERLTLALRSRRLPVEDRPFRPHLTLARFREPRPGAVLEAIEFPAEVARFLVENIVLFRSILTSSGARHSVIDTFDLVSAPVGVDEDKGREGR